MQSYHDERHPVAQLSKATSERHLGIRAAIYRLYEEACDLRGDGAEAAARRTRVGRRIAALGNMENESWGTEQGYRYAASPVVPDEAGYPPAFDMLKVTPSTWPGSILPSLFLADGSAVYDLLGKWFTLIVLDDSDTAELETAAKAVGLPLDVVRIRDPHARTVYETPLVLVRPDHHVAWRGDILPGGNKLGAWRKGEVIDTCADLIDKVRGA